MRKFLRKFCLNCGEELFLAPKHKKFCCPQCWNEYQRKKIFLGDRVHTINNSFQFFKTIVNASQTPQEFNAYWECYFGGGKSDGAGTERRPRAK